jgi:hypothetical protein
MLHYKIIASHRTAKAIIDFQVMGMQEGDLIIYPRFYGCQVFP